VILPLQYVRRGRGATTCPRQHVGASDHAESIATERDRRVSEPADAVVPSACQ
jgi:hypothetical protein